jgi:hypothetical protein
MSDLNATLKFKFHKASFVFVLMVFLGVHLTSGQEAEKEDSILELTDSTFEKSVNSIEHVLIAFYNPHE